MIWNPDEGTRIDVVNMSTDDLILTLCSILQSLIRRDLDISHFSQYRKMLYLDLQNLGHAMHMELKRRKKLAHS